MDTDTYDFIRSVKRHNLHRTIDVISCEIQFMRELLFYLEKGVTVKEVQEALAHLEKELQTRHESDLELSLDEPWRDNRHE